MTDALAVAERQKYARMWEEPTYRDYSPGADLAQRAVKLLTMKSGETITDYGCGEGKALDYFHEQGLLVAGVDIVALRPEIIEAPLWNMPPELRSDWAYCVDVMEHIPPEKVDDVLREIGDRTARGAVFSIATQPDAMGALIGENLHLTVQSAEWWFAKLQEFWGQVEWHGTVTRTSHLFVCRQDAGRKGILDPAKMSRQLGGQVTKRIGLEVLAPIEEAILERAPLPVTYDVNRPQPWYFTEFSYTEFMGGVIITPMCDEIAARLVDASLAHQSSSFDAADVVRKRLAAEGTLDKYALGRSDIPDPITDLILLPGSNLLYQASSVEMITRVMWERPGAYLKPHPLTHAKHMRELRIRFGGQRIIPAKTSGFQAVQAAETIWATGTTELAAYAVLLDKPVRSVANIFNEKGGTFFPVFRLIADVDPATARERLLRILHSDRSGILFAEDPDWSPKLDAYFSAAMEMREQFRPLVFHAPPMPKAPAKT